MAGTTTWFIYDEFGQTKKTESENLCVVRTLDNFGRLSRYESSADETDVYVVNNLSYASETDDTVVSEQVQYVSEDTQGDNLTTLATTYAKDDLQRPTSTTVMQGNFGFRYNYSYVPRRTRTWVSGNGQVAYALPPIRDGHWDISDVGTTQYVSQFKQYNVSENEETLVATDNLEYDANGNITKYGNVTYKYDKFNRLVRENNPTLDKTTTWCYDVSGNVCSRTEYSYTTGTVGTPVATFNYAYGNGWKDQLTAYNGQSITYDQAGNPTSYLGKTLGWTRGRLLASYNFVSMQYDANGIRTRKVVPTTNGTETTEYIYSGNNLFQEKVAINQTETFCKYFLYNSQGVVGFVQNGTTYLFRKNFFGDVTAIYRGATKVAEYAYDAWGNCTIVSDTNGIGTANPFRYRSYFWDNDLQLYYLMSRYYDPQVGRFLNADGLEYLDPETLGGLNLYAYCLNNPTKYIDKYGTEATLALIAATAMAIAAIVGLICIITGAISVSPSNPSLDDPFVTAPSWGQIGQGISSWWQELGEDWNDLQEAIKEALYSALKKQKIKKRSDGRDLHHIVAKKDPRAFMGRIILWLSGINVYTDFENLASVRRERHWVLHTTAYHATVSAAVFLSYIVGGEEGVKATLDVIRAILEAL